jgi:hypothetical protein
MTMPPQFRMLFSSNIGSFLRKGKLSDAGLPFNHGDGSQITANLVAAQHAK